MKKPVKVGKAKADAFKQEQTRQRTLVKDVLWPYLLKNTKSIEDAKQLLTMADMYLQKAFSDKVSATQLEWSEKKVSELGMKDAKAADPKLYKEILGVVSLFDGERVKDGTNLLGGMAKAIESFQKEEATKRGLETLKTTFLV